MSMAKILSVAVLLVVAITALGPAHWQPRTMLGWELDHFLGYFGITFLLLLAWPRPWFIGVCLLGFAVVLEGLQALTPDRSPNFFAVLYSAFGVFVSALFVWIWSRSRRR